MCLTILQDHPSWSLVSCVYVCVCVFAMAYLYRQCYAPLLSGHNITAVRQAMLS